jgi:hypothetical protein
MPQRIQLSRRKGWRKPEGAIVVARPSRWGNPFSVERWGRDRAIAWFRMLASGIWDPQPLADLIDDEYEDAYLARNEWLARHHHLHPTELARAELAGHDLACWCPLDQPCHADVLLEIANGG